jgi:hypothetical protein
LSRKLGLRPCLSLGALYYSKGSSSLTSTAASIRIRTMVTGLLRVSFLSMIPIPFSSLMEQMAAILDSASVSVVVPKKNQNMAMNIASDEQTKTTFLAC